MQPRQLPLAGDVHGYGVCSLRARAEPGHSAQLCYRGTLGPDARVCTGPEDLVGAELAEPAKRPAACSRPEKSAIQSDESSGD